MHLLRCQLLGIATGSLAGFSQIDLQEFSAYGAYLFCDYRSGVKGGDLGSHALGCCNGLQPRDASTDNEHIGGFQCPCRGHHHREDTRQMSRGLYDHYVTRQAGLRAQGIHFLAAGGARDHLHTDGSDAGVLECVDQSVLVERVQVADMHGAALHLADFFELWFAQAQQEVSGAE